MGFSAKSALALALIATSVALLAVYNTTEAQLSTEVGDNLDCGFTQDFQDFISANGTHFPLFRLLYFPIQPTGHQMWNIRWKDLLNSKAQKDPRDLRSW